MYIETIKFNKELSDEKLNELRRITNKAFDNRMGKIESISVDKYTLIFQGSGEIAYGVLHLGALDLFDEKEVIKHICSWTYIDSEEPEESDPDVLASLSIKVY